MSTNPRNEASRKSFSPAVRRLADHLEAQEHAVEFYDVIALGGLDKALDVEEMATVAHHVLAHAEASHMAMAVAEAIAKHLATPVPEIAPGTAGTATITWVTPPRKGVRVMRVADTYSWVDDRGNRYTDESVTDFVPDLRFGSHACPRCGEDVINRKADPERTDLCPPCTAALFQPEIERLRGQLADRSNDARRYLEQSRDYKKSAELNKGAAESAQDHADMLQERIDAVLNLADQWKAAQKENAAALERHELLPCKVPDADDFRYAATGCLEVPPVESDAAPEPRPAFVLPEREAVRVAIADAVNEGATSYDAAAAVLALLAEHAVTEGRLAEALERTFDYQRLQVVSTFEQDARGLLAHLTGKAS